jgi:integrase
VEVITAEAVNEWVGSSELAHLAPTTVKGIVKTLQTALGKKFGRGKISYPSNDEVETEPRCYLAEEVEKIVDAANGQYKVLFKLAAETGARAGELYALTVDDLLFGYQQEHVQPESGLSEDQKRNPLDQRQALRYGDAEGSFERQN